MNTAASGSLRVGIAGAGLMGQWHAHTVKRVGGHVVGVADPDSARAQEISDKFAARAFGSVGEMLKSGGIDVLHICTTSASHDAIIRQALEHDVHVFVEKPLATTAKQTRTLNALARKRGKALCPVHQYAFQRSVETVLRQQDRVGALTHVDLKFFSAGADNTPTANHARIAADILPHPVSILQRLFPNARPHAADWNIRASDSGSWQLNALIQGVFVNISISLRARPTCARMTLHGGQGSFAADLFHDYVLFRDGTASRRKKMQRPFLDALGHLSLASVNIAGRLVRKEPAYPGLQTLTRKFHAACAGQGPQPIPADDIIAAAEFRDSFLDRMKSPMTRKSRK